MYRKVLFVLSALVLLPFMRATQSPYALVGRKAPDFTAQGVIGRGVTTIKLKDYEGSYLVIFFYPADNAELSQSELLALQAKSSAFAERGVRIVACSTDSVDSHRKWLKAAPRKQGVRGVLFPLLSDVDAKMVAAYQVASSSGRPFRATVIIDPKGVVQSISIDNLLLKRDIEEVLRRIDGLIVIEKSRQMSSAG